MSQHFLLSSRARTLTLASVMRMSEEEVERVFIRLRWADNKGEPLLAIAILCNEVKGKSMLAMARDLGVQYKTSFVLAHKIREAMASEVRQTSIGGEYEINTNSAESFFSRMRRGEIGHHHHLAGPYLIRFAQESAWREDHRKDPNGQVDRVVALAMKNKPSVDFCGYWQRSWAA